MVSRLETPLELAIQSDESRKRVGGQRHSRTGIGKTTPAQIPITTPQASKSKNKHGSEPQNGSQKRTQKYDIASNYSRAGPRNRVHFRDPLFTIFVFEKKVFRKQMCRKQVKLWWIWKEWLLLEALATEDVVIINLDETALQHHYHGRRGNMIKCIRRGNAVIGARRSFAEKVDTSKTRAHTTLVAMICNDNALQKYLPQILLPGSKTRPCSRAQEALFAGIGAPVETWKDTTGWVNGEIFQRILTRIRAAVRSRRPAAKVLLVIDAACQHIGQDVLRHAARLGLFLLLIPLGVDMASTTTRCFCVLPL